MTCFGRGSMASGLALACLTFFGCGGDDKESGRVATSATATATATATNTTTRTPTLTPTFTPTFTLTASPTRTPTFSATPTATITATSTATATNTPQGPLGLRHFVLSPNKSPFIGVLGEGFALTLGGFQGQTNGEPAPGFIDFEAGRPDPTTGIASLDITAASDYLYVTIAQANFTLCIKPIVPVMSAGIIDCDGGLDFSTILSLNHHVGQIGVDGFTAAQCDSAQGSIEGPNQICAAGMPGEPCRTNSECDSSAAAGDGVCGVSAATCTEPPAARGTACHADGDCDSAPAAPDGVCGEPGVHPGVCNGSFMVSQFGTDSGPGAAVIAPQAEIGLNGLPVELTFENALPCGDEGPGQRIGFAVTTGTARGIIENFSNEPDHTLMFDAHGTNFSCANWQTSPGKFVLTAPALHQAPGGGDIITVFTFGSQ